MRVSVTHTTRLDYTQPVSEGVMDTRLGPLNDAHQRWERHELQLAPGGSIRTYLDAFRNNAALLTVPRPHTFVQVVASGVVETLLADPFMVESPSRPLSAAERFDFLTESRLVQVTDGVRDLAAPHRPPRGEDTLDAVQGLMRFVYEAFTYQQHVTTVSTLVPELLETRTGVCQDFAHVLLALCRANHVPARYVSGYIVSHTATPDGERGGEGPPARGAGESHAWVEAWTPTHGWRGFDPTNNVLASESHIKMAIGRDYGDVPPTRGTFRGAAEEALSVEVVAVPEARYDS